MYIIGTGLGKKYEKNWIFRNISFEIERNQATAITGKNGAGKSTLLRIISGYLTPSEGNIKINNIEKATTSFISPYCEMIEELTLEEFLKFHSYFQKPTYSFKEMASSAMLPLSKPISEFSTGMKQRVKLITAFFFENELIFMDEPTSNLDEQGASWWSSELEKIKNNRTIIIASNLKNEIDKCSNILSL